MCVSYKLEHACKNENKKLVMFLFNLREHTGLKNKNIQLNICIYVFGGETENVALLMFRQSTNILYKQI